MGRLIDADKIMDKMESIFDMQELYLPIHFKELIIDDMPSIEAIPKDQYEARLKADLEAILVELQLEIEELNLTDSEPKYQQGAEETREYIANLLEEKIDKLKGVEK